jgi:hypothetical protein
MTNKSNFYNFFHDKKNFFNENEKKYLNLNLKEKERLNLSNKKVMITCFIGMNKNSINIINKIIEKNLFLEEEFIIDENKNFV